MSRPRPCCSGTHPDSGRSADAIRSPQRAAEIALLVIKRQRHRQRARARGSSAASSSPCMRARSFSVVTRTRPSRSASPHSACARRACSDGDRGSCASRRPRRRRRAALRRISPDRRCRQRRERACRPSDAMNARVGLEPRRETPAARACARRRRPAPHRRRRPRAARLRAIELRVERRAQRPGRKHPAVADAAPAVDDEDGKILGQRRILEAVVHHDDARAGRDRGLRARRRDRARRWSARRARAAAARRRRRPRDAATDRPAPGRRAARHSRGSGKPASRRRPRACCATAIAVGVLPAPPTVGLPMQITGTPACAPGCARRRAATAP